MEWFEGVIRVLMMCFWIKLTLKLSFFFLLKELLPWFFANIVVTRIYAYKQYVICLDGQHVTLNFFLKNKKWWPIGLVVYPPTPKDWWIGRMDGSQKESSKTRFLKIKYEKHILEAFHIFYLEVFEKQMNNSIFFSYM